MPKKIGVDTIDFRDFTKAGYRVVDERAAAKIRERQRSFGLGIQVPGEVTLLTDHQPY
mgnify:FL=1